MFKIEEMTPEEEMQAANQREVGLGEWAAAKTGLLYPEVNTTAPLIDEAKIGLKTIANQFESYDPNAMTLEDRINARARGEDVEVNKPLRETMNIINREEFEKRGFGEHGVEWRDGLTVERAEVEFENSKEMETNRAIVEAGSTPAREALGFGIGLALSVPDPINLLPGAGAVKGAKIGTTMLKTGAMAAVENVAVDAALMSYNESQGGEGVTTQQLALSAVFGFGIGGAIGGGVQRYINNKAALEISNKSKEVMAEAVSKTAEAVQKGETFDPRAIPGFEEARTEILNSGNKSRVKHINDNAKAISEATGIDIEDAKDQLIPVVLHAEFRASETGELVEDILAGFRIQVGKSGADAKAKGVSFKIADEPKAEIDHVRKKIFDTEIAAMAEEVQGAEKGQRSTAVIDNPEKNDGMFKYVNTSTKSTYPKWYRKLGVKNKDHFLKVINSKKGKVWERIKEVANDRLENGYLDNEGVPFEPSNEWRQLQGLEPVVLQQDAPAKVSGKVIEFDGLEGVIKTDDGRTVYFDEDSINTGRAKPGIGERVEIDIDDKGDFEQVGTLYQSATRRESGVQVRQSEVPLPDDFEAVNVSSRISVGITNRDGIRGSLEHSFKSRFVEIGHTGHKLKVGALARKEMVSHIPKIKDSVLKADHVRIAKNPNVFNEIINKAIWVERAPDTKGRGGYFNYYFSEIEIGKRKYVVELEAKDSGGEIKLYAWKLGRLEMSPDARKVIHHPKGPDARRVSPSDTDSLSRLETKLNEALSNNSFMQDAENPRGKIDFLDTGESVVTLFKGADNSTVLHETGHFFLNSLEEIVDSGKASKQTVGDLKTVNKWLDTQDYKATKTDIDKMVGVLKEKGFPLKGQSLRKFAKDQVERVNRHEFFARGFETYLYEGNAPSIGVARIFEKFKGWFRDLYKSREALNSNITDEMRDVYSRLMGGQENFRLPDELPPIKAPRVEIDTTDFDEFLESYNQGALDEFTSDEIEKVLAIDEATQKAIDFYKAAKSDLSLFQGDSANLKEVAEQLGLSLGEAKKLGAELDRFGSIDDARAKQQTVAFVIDELVENLERQKFLEKRNAGLQLKAKQRLVSFVEGHLDKYKSQGRVKNFLNSNFTPEKLILAALEGDSRMRGVEGAGRAIFSDYQGLSQFYTQRMVKELTDIDPNIEKILDKDPAFQENIILEMREIREDGSGRPGISGDEKAQRVAELFSKNLDEMRQRLNDAGSDIGKLDGYVPRRHDFETMVLAKKDGWVNDVTRLIDREKSFPGISDKELKETLEETYENLITGIHTYNELPGLTDEIMATPSNMARRLGKSRKLHFKSSADELEYLKKYSGGMNIVETVFSQMDQSARMTAIMERLGPNPDSTIYSTIETLKKGLREGKYGIDKNEVRELVSQLPSKQGLVAREGSIGQSMAVITGETQMVQNVTAARVGSFVRSMNTLSKLMAATLSQFSDAVSVTNEFRIVNNSSIADAWGETLKAYFKTSSPEVKSEVLDYLGVISDGFNMASFNRFDGIDSLDNKMRRMMERGFKLSGMTQMTNKAKSGFALALSKELGSSMSKSFDELTPGIREVLSQYGGIDSVKWDIIRAANAKQIDGKNYLTPDLIQRLDDEAFDLLLPEELRANELFDDVDSATSKKRSAEIKRVKRDLESSLRSVFVEETRNAVLEPDARAMRTTTGGQKRGTLAGEAWRMMMQFKSFSVIYTQRTLGGRRFMKSDGDYGGVLHHSMATMLLGYMSMVAKDLSKGREPRDPTQVNTWVAAAMQGGGLGIIGDLAFTDANRFGGGFLATVGGPTLGVAEDLYKLTMGNIHKAAGGGEADFASDLVNFIQYNNPIAPMNLWYTRTALNYLFWYRLREALNPGSLRRSERRMKRENNQEYFWAPSEAVR